MKRKTLLLALLAVGLAAAGGLAIASAGDGPLSFEDDDNDENETEERLDVALAEGESYTLEATAANALRGVEGGYELKNTGDAAATVTVTLTGPDGEALGTRTAEVPAGKAGEFEIEHAFDGAGPAGTYAVTITVDSGSVHLTEGEVEFAGAA